MFSYMPPCSLFKTIWNIVAMSFAKLENRATCFHAVDAPKENVCADNTILKKNSRIFTVCKLDCCSSESGAQLCLLIYREAPRLTNRTM